MFDFLAFTYRCYSQTVLVLLSFSVPDIVMRRRSICRRRTKPIVAIVNCNWIELGGGVSYAETVQPCKHGQRMLN